MKKCVTVLCVMLMVFMGLSGCKQSPANQEANVPIASGEDETYSGGLQVELYAYDTSEDQQYITIYELAPDVPITAENIIKAYQTQVMEGVYGLAVGVNEVRLSQDSPNKLYIDFKGDDMEALNLEEGSEGNYFGGLAASITANIPEIGEIYYSIDGNDFIIGHLWFSKSEPFWTSHEEPTEE